MDSSSNFYPNLHLHSILLEDPFPRILLTTKFLHLVRLSDICGIDLGEAARELASCRRHLNSKL
uniref:Uncharacterized protein n=1 Tax=Solanum lycopersicum TaxID=4081 RepID=A0A3Q7IAE2_SOLLC